MASRRGTSYGTAGEYTTHPTVYRHQWCGKHSPMPDLYIGAPALVSNLRLLTRDAPRYASYSPTLEIISP